MQHHRQGGAPWRRGGHSSKTQASAGASSGAASSSGPDTQAGSRAVQAVSEADDAKHGSSDVQGLPEAIAAAEREGGYEAAHKILEARSAELPAPALCKAHLELMECAKRESAPAQVRYHLAQALQAQPRASQVWLEACRTCDELGELQECRSLLEKGLELCTQSEQLAQKLVRVLERLGDHAALRSLVGGLKRDPPERTNKVLLEAAHFEVRAGNGEKVRALLRCLLQRLPRHGPIHCEACRVESILGHSLSSLAIAEQGVQTCLKYGPLWFVLIRQAERSYGAKAVHEYANHALRNVCHELHWKMHFEVAAAYGREGNLQSSREAVAQSAFTCPKHLRWKVWLLAARSELMGGSVESNNKLLERAKKEAPQRMRAQVCIEQARTQEFLGNLQEAKMALDQAHACEGHDWKVFLEHIFMEARQGKPEVAKETAHAALDLHPATGRLWSALIALEHSGKGGVESAMQTFRRAVREVPKSGEVWCEGARAFMNPLVSQFHIGRAMRCLEFAIQLTPQYGDSFLELVRLKFLLEIRMRMRNDSLTVGLLGPPPKNARGCTLKHQVSCDESHRLTVATLVARRVCLAMAEDLRSEAGQFEFDSSIIEEHTSGLLGDPDSETSQPRAEEGHGETQRLLRRLEVICTYADPNYGFLWFWCRRNALSTPQEVLAKMHAEVVRDLLSGAMWAYAWAVACGVFQLRHGDKVQQGNGVQTTTGAVGRPKAPPDVPEILDTQGSHEHNALSIMPYCFALGSLPLSRALMDGIHQLDAPERQRVIFGSDILCG